MNIVLYGVPAKTAGRIAGQYGLKVINSPDKFDASGTMVLVPPISTPRYLLAFYNAMLRHEDDVDAVIICGIESCEAASTVQYCTPPGKFFSLNGGVDEEELLSELRLILDSQPAQRLTARQAPCRCRRSSAARRSRMRPTGRPQRRVRRILTAAPVENRPSPFHTTDSASWKNPHTSVRYSGMRPPLPHFISIPNSSEAVRATSNPQASSDGRTSSGWRQGLPSGRVQLPSGQ